MDLNKPCDVAIEAVSIAAKTGFYFKQTSFTSKKTDSTPITVADIVCQIEIIQVIRKSYPEALIIGEELSVPVLFVDEINRYFKKKRTAEELNSLLFSSQQSDSGLVWIIDPIDGTTGYISGESYCHCVSLLSDGVVLVGAISCPTVSYDATSEGSILYAMKGKGTYQTGLFDSKKTQKRLTIQNENGMWAAPKKKTGFLWKGILEEVDPTKEVSANGQCKAVLLCLDQLEFCISYRSTPQFIWDHTAAYLFVYEAGGIVGDLNGAVLDFKTGRVLTHNSGVVYAKDLKTYQKIVRMALKKSIE